MGDEGRNLPKLPAEERQELERQLQDIESQAPMVDEDIGEDPLAMMPMPAPTTQMPSFEPLPQTSAPMGLPTTPLSPGLLPSEEDREIAMRRQQGIAGLMV
jgi:hypothetical protein